MQSNLSSVKKFSRLQAILLTNLSLLFIVISLAHPTILSYEFQYYLLLLTVAIIGIPHGFFDYSIAKRLFSNNSNWVYFFTFGYILLSLFYLILWLKSPLLSMIVFLLISILHFGMEEQPHIRFNEMNYFKTFLLSSVPIVIPILFHTQEVFSIFEQIIGVNFSHINFSIYFYFFYFLSLLVALYFNGTKKSILYLILIPNLILLPPLVSFILYFCFYHSIKHYILSIYEDNLIPESYTIGEYLNIIITSSLVFTAIIIGIFYNYTNYTFDIIIVKYIFILLACLTLPHLLLNIYYDSKK